MKRIIVWNNKGGTGKTSLAFQLMCEYANTHSDKRLLAVDMCPQANLSELLLGGLNQGGSEHLLERQKTSTRATVGGYFQLRLPSPYTPPVFDPEEFITKPVSYNPYIPDNIDLLCGDPLLELQSNAISTLSNNQIPGTDTWLAIINWLNDFLSLTKNVYDIVVFDANPSFSIYTQIAIASSERIVLPVMADDSSRRAIQNAFSLVYGLKLPSEIYTRYAFAEKLKDAGKALPKVHMILKNRITQYMGAASAYATVLNAIDREVKSLLYTNPEIFTFSAVDDGIAEIRDFQTTGVVSSARGCPFFRLSSGKQNVLGRSVQIKEEYRQTYVENIRQISCRVFDL